MQANLENSAVAAGLEKVSFHSSPKERQCQRMLKLLYNCTHFTCFKVMLKILQSYASAIWESRTFRCTTELRKCKGSEFKLPTFIGSQGTRGEIPMNHILLLHLTTLKILAVWITQTVKILKEIGIPDHFTCILRNLCRSRRNT